MDEKIRRAEELLAQRRVGRTNGEPVVESETDTEDPTTEQEPSGRTEDKATADAVAGLTNDLKRMAADFANYRKRNEAERTEFAKFAKSDLIAKLLDVLDGYDRALATVPEELKGQPWVEGM